MGAIIAHDTLPARLDALDSTPLPGQRIVSITGSTGGPGRETARAPARQGDHVIIHGRNEELLAAIPCRWSAADDRVIFLEGLWSSPVPAGPADYH